MIESGRWKKKRVDDAGNGVEVSDKTKVNTKIFTTVSTEPMYLAVLQMGHFLLIC